ncbi:MAG: FAD-dependent oxidoreductase, partial [Alphaproteobacteria bacterium]|nr:FAD-dependent oxidoreductase [Alphaproteobacteria bacterium]
MKIAVIGSGIAGLGSAWLLNQKYDVTVYEKNATVGGHSNTIDAPVLGGESLPVDTGFIVYNERTYPNLIGLLDTLGVTRIKTDMSFGVSVDQGRLEYGGSDLKSLFAQKRNLISPQFIRMVRDILRFYKVAPGLLTSGMLEGMTLADLLARDGYSNAFIDNHLLPMAAAIWSCPVSKMGEFPAASFIRFFDNHGLLQVENRPQWWTVQGGSREYVRRIRADLGRDVLVSQGVKAVTRGDSAVTLNLEDGCTAEYDRVVFACHGDQAHCLLGDKTKQESDILSRFTYQTNRAILHSDVAQMPKRRKVWSSWNYLT